MNNTNYQIEIYKENMPKWGKATLVINHKKVSCLPTGLTSGKIENSSSLTTSLISSKYFIDTPHINFNPKCDQISRANFSFAPSLAISRSDISKFFKVKAIKAEIVVRKEKRNTYQVLVGNIKNPKNIIFSHFDSVGTGAADNASGTALMLDCVVRNKKLLKDSLFVFDGNEEISYDYPTYWGKGYRNFEKKYQKQIARAKKIIVVDCIGYAKTEILSGKENLKIINLAFPIKNVKKFSRKMTLVTSDYDTLMSVYHSDLDNQKIIKARFVKEAKNILLHVLK